jgi:hypothetical protein
MTTQADGEAKLAGVEKDLSNTVEKMKEIKVAVEGVNLGPLAIQVAKTIATHAAAVAVIADLMQKPLPQDQVQVTAITESLRKSSAELQVLLDSLKSPSVAPAPAA